MKITDMAKILVFVVVAISLLPVLTDGLSNITEPDNISVSDENLGIVVVDSAENLYTDYSPVYSNSEQLYGQNGAKTIVENIDNLAYSVLNYDNGLIEVTNSENVAGDNYTVSADYNYEIPPQATGIEATLLGLIPLFYALGIILAAAVWITGSVEKM